MATSVLIFEPLSVLMPGDLAKIIGRSYTALVEGWPDKWAAERPKWDEFDRQAFAHPETVGRCVFVTCLGPEPVGLGSFDPRPAPAYGLVGQNCVLPEFRGRGIGRRQVLEILRRLRAEGMRAVRVTTSEHPFFEPAIKMYRGAGFFETRRYPGGPDPDFKLVELEIALGPGSELDR